ncbi:glutathione S-transferase T2-like [Hordeum vulgare]|nr:glutathione S-transferase T2-like [Hordeum vulgare]
MYWRNDRLRRVVTEADWKFEDDDDRVQTTAEALVLYKSKDPKNRQFALLHCWLELQKHPKWETHVVSKGPQKKQKRTFDASPGTTSNDEDFGSPDALDTEIRPDGHKQDKESSRKVRASDALAPKLSLETVWAQKLEKAEVKETAKNARYERAFELQEKQIAMQERQMAQKQFELEEKIMSMDTSAMSGAEQQYYTNKQNEIVAHR